ncbi:ribonuclease III [Candidatus Aerophobetes bacterium]|uniref:Ribonuclease 3 n=1 Tax=Aerophobetes bacterium TaxID=2030807 RepID=A0A2A4YKH6_UNCAE|nr:MAG: ribonuclease III [Candidatus Aerophobetes bacterium]
MMPDNFDTLEIEKKLGYTFKDKGLLKLAFTHRSFVNENKEISSNHNERLEFLGDAILGLMVSEFLYKTLPESKEGDLSFLRANLVEASSCYQFLQMIEISEFLLMGKGEMMNQGKGRDTILADLFEAVIGAIYIDSGMDMAKEFFFSKFETKLHSLIREPSKNWKALLQDYLQKKYQKQPTYTVIDEEGPDHEKTFHIGVYLDKDVLGKGSGLSKKEAEQNAAEDALKKLSSG